MTLTGEYSYEVLNLTQDHQQLSHRQQQQQQLPQGLRQQLQHGLQQQQQQYPFIHNSSLEVGLNLSLQVSMLWKLFLSSMNLRAADIFVFN